MACYYIVISSTHLRDGQLRSIKGVFRGPIGAGGQRSTEEGDSSLYCELCDKQYVRHQQYDNHINSYDHHHKQRLKELKQREFYRALACRRQRRRREEKREERALRRLKHEERRSGECAPGSGPMFRSTTVAVDPSNQSRPDFVQNWGDIHASSAALGTKPQTQLMLPLDPALETRLLSNAQWAAYDPMDASGTAAAGLDYSDLNADNTSTRTSHFNKIPWAHNYLSEPITPNDIPTTATNTTNGSIFNTTDISINSSRADVQAVRSRVRPVSFSLPKRSCVLLHQSAAVFIQAGRVSGKQDGVTAQERAKDLGEKVTDQQLKSPVSADMDAVGHWDTGNQCSVDSKPATQHSEAGANMSAERGTGGLSGTGAQGSSCNVSRDEDSVISGRGAQLSLCNDNGTGAQDKSESGTGAHLYSHGGTPGELSDTAVEAERHDDESNPAQELKDRLCPAADRLQKPIPGVENDSKDSSIRTQPKEPTSSPPNRPKEPFCRVLSRDGSRVLLWPSEMVRYTKTSPSISYSINPLLYDFRAHNRAKEGGEEKKGGLEDGRERIKPSVIKQADCQERQEGMEGGREVKTDEREEEDEGGQAGNPVELVAHCSAGDAVPDRCGCRDESALKFVPVSAECHLAPTPGLQKTGGSRRRRRGGVRRGMRKRGRRKRGEEADRKDSERGRRIISNVSENQMFEGRGDERVKREGAEKEEERREKGPLSNLAAHRLVGGREKRMRGEERRIRGDQTERERAGRNDEKRGELLSNLPVNRCNRCNQLCLQVKREASQHQSQQSASGWGHGLRKLLCRGAACNAVISPVPGSVIETPCCPAITPDPAQNDREMAAEMHKNTQAGGREGPSGEERRNLKISAARGEDVCNLVISGASFPCREAARQPEMCLVPAPHGETACDPAISLVPAPFRETACSQRQTIPAGHGRPVSGPAPRCAAQKHTETRAGIRSAGADVTLPGDACSKEAMTKRAADKRKTESPEAGEETPRKKRKRGRRQTRRVAAEENCHFVCRTACGEASNSSADKVDNYCRCGDSKNVDDYSQFSSDGEKTRTETALSDTPSDQEAPRDDNLTEKGGDDAPDDVDSSTCSSRETHADCCENTPTHSEQTAREITQSSEFKCQNNDRDDENRSVCGPEDRTEPPSLSRPRNHGSDPTTDHQTADRRHGGHDSDGGQCDHHNSNHVTDCNHCADEKNVVAPVERRDAARERREEEEKQMERKKVRERQEEWEKEWVRRKERERKVDFEHLYAEKRPRFLPPQCIPLHAPLLLPPSLSSSSSFSFRHTIIQHHLSLLPPPSHLPVHQYPHLLPSFSPHLSPLTPAPPPPPPPHTLHPSFYSSSPIPFLDAPGPFPLATAFHPLQSPHPSLYAPPHPAVLPLQVLF